MNVEEVIQSLNTGKKAAILGSEIGIPDKRLRAAIKAAGYAYDTKKKVWEFVGEGEEPKNKPIQYYASIAINTNSNTKSTRNIPKGNNNAIKGAVQVDELSRNNMTKCNNNYSLNLTEEEAVAFKSMLSEYMERKANETQRDRLHAQIMQLEKEKRSKKTFNISETVIEQFDSFADHMRFSKSDLLELALLDLMRRYSEEESEE